MRRQSNRSPISGGGDDKLTRRRVAVVGDCGGIAGKCKIIQVVGGKGGLGLGGGAVESLGRL